MRYHYFKMLTEQATQMHANLSSPVTVGAGYGGVIPLGLSAVALGARVHYVD